MEQGGWRWGGGVPSQQGLPPACAGLATAARMEGGTGMAVPGRGGDAAQGSLLGAGSGAGPCRVSPGM